MGTQQILLIVLSVIIVGVAIAVGIQMFNSQSYSSNKSAIAADAQSFAAQVVQWYKTPASQGGAGNAMSRLVETTETPWTADEIGKSIGWESATTTNDNGEYTITIGTGSTTVVITGIGKAERESKKPKIVTTITLSSGEITAVASDLAPTP